VGNNIEAALQTIDLQGRFLFW